MILLCFIPFLYLIILVWSIIDCIQLRKKVKVDPLSRKEAITAIIIFLIVIPFATFILILGSFTVIDNISNNYLKPSQTKSEMTRISISVKNYVDKTNEMPKSLLKLIGNNPVKKTWLIDSWQNPYKYEFHGENRFTIISAGKDELFETPDDIIVTNTIEGS